MRSLAHVIPSAVRELLRAAPLSQGKVAFAWRTAVGPQLERATVVALDGSVLVVETASLEWSRELRRSSSTILGRLQGLLGNQTVSRLEIRVNPNLRVL
jgi:hypothetical protein